VVFYLLCQERGYPKEEVDGGYQGMDRERPRRLVRGVFAGI